mmetsp:Transcript_13392/g.36710  ORF Transcript_13392/g.36710 Transcript_13392/m.36710 type:complete len:223 (+) Transcript_13392:53-721(+)
MTQRSTTRDQTEPSVQISSLPLWLSRACCSRPFASTSMKPAGPLGVIGVTFLSFHWISSRVTICLCPSISHVPTKLSAARSELPRKRLALLTFCASVSAATQSRSSRKQSSTQLGKNLRMTRGPRIPTLTKQRSSTAMNPPMAHWRSMVLDGRCKAGGCGNEIAGSKGAAVKVLVVVEAVLVAVVVAVVDEVAVLVDPRPMSRHRVLGQPLISPLAPQTSQM